MQYRSLRPEPCIYNYSVQNETNTTTSTRALLEHALVFGFTGAFLYLCLHLCMYRTQTSCKRIINKTPQGEFTAQNDYVFQGV